MHARATRNGTSSHLRRRFTGIGILSIALGVLVAAVMTAGALSVYSSTRSNAVRATLIDQMSLIYNAVERLYANKNGYPGLDEWMLSASGVLPESMVRADGEIITAAGGSSDVRSYDDRCPGCSDAFYIKFWNIETEHCVTLSQHRVGKPYSMAIGWNYVQFYPPYDLAAIRNTCVSETNSAGKTQFRAFYLKS
jgi:Tfp pilus assembly protein PilE